MSFSRIFHHPLSEKVSCTQSLFSFCFCKLIVFSGKFDAFHLGLGVISCAVVGWLSQNLLYVDRKEHASTATGGLRFSKIYPLITGGGGKSPCVQTCHDQGGI